MTPPPTPTDPLPPALLDLLLQEDLGDRGDVTSEALAEDRHLAGRAVAREPCVASGLDAAARVLRALGADAEHQVAAGDDVPADGVLLEVSGPAVAVLAAERPALNILQRTCAIAHATREVVQAVHAVNPDCDVAATRKTTPGLRALEKQAVVDGGGHPHRHGLHDAFLIKDNHLALVPDVREAVQRCRDLHPDLPLQVEADTLAQALEAAAAGADAVLLDNVTPEEAEAWYRKLEDAHPDVLVEVSGGITPETAPEYAPHADRLSMGWLTHSVRAVDVGLDVVAGDGDA